MNAIFQTVMRLIGDPWRQCPSCGYRQRIPESQRGLPMVCEKCGTTIPPRGTSSSSTAKTGNG